MVTASHTTPLIALDAVVLDTETTGLDPRKARILEIGLVRLVRGRIDGDATLRILVKPDEPIPAAVTVIHGIDEAAVVKQAFLRTLSRFPSDQELARCRKEIQQASDTTAGVRDVLWALLNTKEFIVNH